MLIDTHAHLTDPEYNADLGVVLKRASTAGVETVVTIGTDLVDSEKAVAISQGCFQVYSCIGVHPNEVLKWDKDSLDVLRKTASSQKVVGIGETGLDYHYSPTQETIKKQEMVFRDQLRLAKELGLPLMIHTRDAHPETIQILKEEKAQEISGIIHCYAGDWETAKQYLDLSFLISFGGIVTFGKKAASLQEVAKKIPLNSMVLETDCPWLAPEPHRGKRNEPAYVTHVAQKLAELKGLPFEEISNLTSLNASRIFKFNDHQKVSEAFKKEAAG